MESSEFVYLCFSKNFYFYPFKKETRNQTKTFFKPVSFHSLFRDVSKFAMHFIVEEIDEDTSMEELQKMMLVALVYRILVCFYEVSGHGEVLCCYLES